MCSRREWSSCRWHSPRVRSDSDQDSVPRRRAVEPVLQQRRPAAIVRFRWRGAIQGLCTGHTHAHMNGRRANGVDDARCDLFPLTVDWYRGRLDFRIGLRFLRWSTVRSVLDRLTRDGLQDVLRPREIFSVADGGTEVCHECRAHVGIRIEGTHAAYELITPLLETGCAGYSFVCRLYVKFAADEFF
jgi:hypothetical protein